MYCHPLPFVGYTSSQEPCRGRTCMKRAKRLHVIIMPMPIGYMTYLSALFLIVWYTPTPYNQGDCQIRCAVPDSYPYPSSSSSWGPPPTRVYLLYDSVLSVHQWKRPRFRAYIPYRMVKHLFKEAIGWSEIYGWRRYRWTDEKEQSTFPPIGNSLTACNTYAPPPTTALVLYRICVLVYIINFAWKNKTFFFSCYIQCHEPTTLQIYPCLLTHPHIDHWLPLFQRRCNSTRIKKLIHLHSQRTDRLSLAYRTLHVDRSTTPILSPLPIEWTRLCSWHENKRRIIKQQQQWSKITPPIFPTAIEHVKPRSCHNILAMQCLFLLHGWMNWFLLLYVHVCLKAPWWWQACWMRIIEWLGFRVKILAHRPPYW